MSYIWKNLVVEEMDGEFIRLHAILVIFYKYMCSNSSILKLLINKFPSNKQ